MYMPARFVGANPRVRENSGKVAVMRGPVVYCLEEADNGAGLFKIRYGQPGDIRFQYEPEFLGGVVTVSFTGKKERDWKEDALYRARTPPPLTTTSLVSILIKKSTSRHWNGLKRL